MSSDAEKRSTSRPGAEAGEGSAQKTEHNLLFGVLALELDLIDASQFAEACAAWAVRKDQPLAEILEERRWLDEEGRADVEKLLSRRLRKHQGDVRRSLATAADLSVRELISDVEDARVRETVSQLPPNPKGAYVQIETLDFKPETRSHYTLTRVHGEGGLGAILFETLTSVPPHRGTNDEELRSRIIHAPTPRARASPSSHQASKSSNARPWLPTRASGRLATGACLPPAPIGSRPGKTSTRCSAKSTPGSSRT